ncbi:hypothetical protein ACFL6X_05125 [Candidatus Latescibacterota bacterium]
MSDSSDTMFAREVDFRLEETLNAYAACRGLSVRARDINRRFKELAESAELEQPSPTVGALGDYSRGRIELSERDEAATDEAESTE